MTAFPIDFLTAMCKKAGHEDEQFIEAARFGAKCLCDRLTADDPTEVQDRFDITKRWCSIWRTTSERPRDNSTIVLCNSAMVTYAFYKSEMYYYEGYSGRLSDFTGKWCYKADLWGVSPQAPYYDEVV